MPATMASLESRYTEVVQRAKAAASRAGTNPDRVIVVAVSKAAEPEQIRALVNLGHRDFGENRVPQLVNRAAMMDEYLSRHRVLMRTPKPGSGLFDSPNPTQATPPESIRWHMIGHLQRNKAVVAVQIFDRIDSVDSLRLARRLDAVAAGADRKDLAVLVQVNASGESSKGGFPVSEAVESIASICVLTGLRVQGLMTMAPFDADERTLHAIFGRTRQCLEECRRQISRFEGTVLSMGMSGDFEIAIAEGATQVRLGTALLGERERWT